MKTWQEMIHTCRLKASYTFSPGCPVYINFANRANIDVRTSKHRIGGEASKVLVEIVHIHLEH